MHHLRRLHLSCIGGLFGALRFDVFQSSSGLTQLRFLSLINLSADSVPSEQLRAAFAALRRLRTLHLTAIAHVDLLLSQLPAAAPLLELGIRCTSLQDTPSSPVLRSLHAALPLLSTHLRPWERHSLSQQAEQKLAACALVERVSVQAGVEIEWNDLVGPNEPSS